MPRKGYRKYVEEEHYCRNCKRRMRGSLDDIPDSVSAGSGGYCTGCLGYYNRNGKHRNPDTMRARAHNALGVTDVWKIEPGKTPCRVCNRKMYPRTGQRVGDSVRGGSEHICESCSRLVYKARKSGDCTFNPDNPCQTCSKPMAHRFDTTGKYARFAVDGKCFYCVSVEMRKQHPTATKIGDYTKVFEDDSGKVCSYCQKYRTWDYYNRSDRVARNCLRCRSLMKHNIDPELYYSMEEKCGICGTKPNGRNLHLDHDHTCCPSEFSCGKCFRGILCGPCNAILGYARDDCGILESAIEYLNSNKTVVQ